MKNENKVPKSCIKVAHYIDKNQYKETDFWQRLGIKLHIINCEHCKKYTKISEKLTNLLKKSNLKALDKEEKEALKLKLEI